MRRQDHFGEWWELRRPQSARHKAIFTAITGWITSTLVGLGLTAAAAGVATNLVIGAAFLGLSYLASPRPPTMKTPQAQAINNQTIGPRIRGYGRALLGGTRAFWDSVDGYLYQAVMLHSGEIDAFEDFKAGDQYLSLNGDGDAVNAFRFGTPVQYGIRITTYRGTATQPADAMLMGNFVNAWTPQHQLKGIAYLVARFRSPPADKFQTVFPEGYNTPVRALCRLSRVYDPRTGLTAWSDNPGLAIMDYLTHPDGMKKTLDDIDIPSFSAFADICDQSVLRADGSSEKRYRIWGVYQLTDEPEDVLRKMRATCDAELHQNAEGKIAIRGGRWEAPTVVITERDILGHSLEQGNDRFSAFNELKITYTSPLHEYQSMEATAWVDDADQDERGPIPSEHDLDFVPSPAQARRLAKIHISKSNPRWKGKIRTNLMGLDALGERTIQVILPELEINEAFYVAGFSIDPELKYVDIEIMTISEAAYTWDAATEEGANPAIPEDTSPDLEFPVPAGLALTSPSAGVIAATVTPTAQEGLVLQVQVRRGAGSLWQDMQINTNNASAVFSPASAGSYEGRARWTGPMNVVGEWTFPYATITLP